MEEKTVRGRAARPVRTPVGQRQPLLVSGKEAGYHYRIVNDKGDRIQQFKDAGYELVEAASHQVGERRVAAPTKEGSKAQVSVGNGDKAFLMRIPEEFYKEDQAAKHARINELENSLKKPGRDADYGSVSISRE